MLGLNGRTQQHYQWWALWEYQDHLTGLGVVSNGLLPEVQTQSVRDKFIHIMLNRRWGHSKHGFLY